MEYPSASPGNQALAASLERRVDQASAQAHASLAEVALAAADFDAIDGWCAPGIRSFPHWLAINAGFDLQMGKELLRVGHALKGLPLIAAAFRAGQLSFDKVRQVTIVATPATDELLLEIAQGASGSQLERICRSLRRIAKASAPQHDQEQMARRGFWTHWDDDGMLELLAKLPSEDGAVVMAALEAITGSQPVKERSDSDVKDPADDRWAARRADALVAMCEQILAGGAGELVGANGARQVVVHVDVGVLTGEAPDGRCFIEGGSALSAEAARRLGCDAQVVAMIERDGLPIDVGKKHRMPSDRQRRALQVRDRCCRFPGCGVPARRTESHHIDHWVDGGMTDLANLICLCGFHHRRHHDGGYQIKKVAGGFRFETDDGHLLGPVLTDPVDREQRIFAPETARALWGGAAMDFDYAISVYADACEFAEARAAPAN